jgi:hypothetical protein
MALSEELVRFVREGLERGTPRAELQDVLLKAGWPAEQVRRALAGFAEIAFPIPVPRPVTAVSARDAFMYVVMFATLLVSAYSLGDLSFDLINYAVPDPGRRSAEAFVLQAIRWSLSALIVAFPVFLYTAALIRRDIARDPTKRALKARRQLTYVMLFIAACVLIGDLIAVVYTFLGGELTVRFVLKVAVVALIAGTVFGYYRWDLGQDEASPET